MSALAGVDENPPYRTIATGFTLVVLIMILLVVFSVTRLQGINDKLAVVVNEDNVATELAYRIHIAGRERALLLQTILLTEDRFDQEKLVQRFHRAALEVDAARKALQDLPLPSDARELLADQGRNIAQSRPLQEDVLALAMAGKSDEARQFLLKSVVPAQDKTLASLAKLLDFELEESRHAADESKREYLRAIAFVGMFGLFGVVFCVLTGAYVFRKMKSAMIKLTEVAGDLGTALNDLQYRQFAMDQHAIVSIADAAGNITYVNDKLSEISHYSPGDLLGKDHRMLKSDHHSAEFFDEMWQTIAGGKVWKGEVCNRNKLGGCYWVATTIVPCLDDHDVPYQYIAIRTDITALKEVQNALALNTLLLEQTVETRTKELAEREEVLSSITGSANEAIIMIDSEGNVSYWNPAAVKVFGYSAQEASGKYLHGMIVPSRYLGAHKQAFEWFRTSGEGGLIGKTVEVEAVRKNGSEFPLELSLSAVKIKGRWSAIGIARDITERKQTTAALNRFKNTLDNTMDMIFMFEPDTLHFVYLNKGAVDAMGYAREELMALTPYQIKPLMPESRFREAIAPLLLSQKSSLSFETVHRRKDGSDFPVEVFLQLVKDGSEKGLFVAIVRDITERKRNDQAMHQANAELKAMNVKLQDVQHQLLQSEKMASVGQLAAGVAHEINNPISYVYSNIGTLEKHLVDLFNVLAVYELADSAIADNDALLRVQSAKAKADLEFLKEDLPTLLSESKEGISRVKKIVQDLKDFSHVDASDEWQLTNLHRGLDSTLNIVSNEIKYKADVIKEYEDLPDVECLPSQINQVLLNLLVNAAHAIEERGTITLRTGCRDGEVWVEVEDTGKGIAPEHMKKIFDPFFTTKPIGKGTGLGLSLSYGIIHKHHGRIEVRSALGKGSAFRVWLPMRQPEVQLAQGLTAQ